MIKNSTKKLLMLLAAGAAFAGLYRYRQHLPILGQQAYKNHAAGMIVDYEPERDKAFIKQLFKDNWEWLVADNNYSVDHMLDNRASQQNAPGGDLTLKVYLVNQEPVGFLAYYQKSFYKGFILFLAVQESERKKGYAEKMLRYALAQLKEQGMTVAQLITRVDNIKAQSLYKKAGMREYWRDDTFVRFEIDL